MEAVVHSYGEPGMSALLTKADEQSYRVEEAGKKLSAAVPSTAEAAARYDSVVGRIRHATGEGLAAITGATSEATAAWKILFAECETAIRSG